MTQQAFVKRREKDWKELEEIITGGEKALRRKAAWFPQAFRELNGDLNTARSHSFDPSLIEKLNRLTLEGSQLLYGREPFSLKKAYAFVFGTFPRALRSQWRSFAACSLLFYGLAVFTMLVCLRFPPFTFELMSRWEASNLEAMYDPESHYYLSPREVATDADMFGYYIFNNVSIAFRNFAGGIIAGIGSLLSLAVNGIFFGAAAAHIINKGFQHTFFSFVIGHSGFELTALILSAQAGLHLGYRFFITGGLGRGESLRKAGKTSLPIIAGSTLMLVIAAAIEAFWSSRHELPVEIRYGAGIFFIVIIAAYFIFAGRRGKPAGEERGAL
ncbi:MAG: stage II sporulation protein M [Treponema sp.]|jgi:uncharacterized membrane protein SpoIIM required for sporulation|nr:stage II sporulation protein M [Treponema sp.]